MDRTELLRKVAGELRSGRRPISVEKLLENEAEEAPQLPDFAQESMARAANAMVKMSMKIDPRLAAAAGVGAVGALGARQVNEDRKMGRMLRKQQQQQGY